ncbi:hypothetical protein ACNOYE_32070 [Nannocystaceae bacterium ST9]
MLASFTFASLLVLSPPEHASVSLGWNSPIGCPTREQALSELRELLPNASEGPEAELRVEIAIAGQPEQRFVAELRFVGARGVDERSIVGASCEVVASAALLVVAVTIDPIATVEQIEARTAEVEPEPSPRPEPAVSPESVEPDEQPLAFVDPRESGESLHLEPEPEPATRPTRARVALGVLGGGGWGPLRAGSGSLAIELGVFGPWWRWELRGSSVLPRALDTDAGRRARYDAWLIATRGCLVPPLAQARVELPVCLGLEAGVLRGRGIGSTPNPRGASQPWAAARIGAGLRWVPRPRFALGFEIDLLAALLRGGFTIGDEVAQRHAPVGVRALVGVEVRLP